MRWLDTRESWDWFKKLWGVIFRAAHVVPGERLMFPFSFGPFVGFWAAFEGACGAGEPLPPAGGLSTASRLKMAVENEVDVICCTPTYALHMADAAREAGSICPVEGAGADRGGEAGGSVPEVRRRIEEGWGARVFDHNGMTEMGRWASSVGNAPARAST
jgi:phenylacetate-CoA ligase